MTMMRAAMVRRYGPPDNVHIESVPTPVPGDDEVLVQVTATSVNSGDARVRAANVPGGMGLPFRLAMGWKGPKHAILGLDGAGVVAAVGKDVTRFAPGDRVVASRVFKFGCHAAYFTVKADEGIALIPDGVRDVDAVSVLFGGATALNFFNLGKLQKGERVLINGASGAVGVMAVQIARLMGCPVLGVCSGRNAELVRDMGADLVIDYARMDFTRSSARYDVIMDTHGNAPFARVRHLLTPEGRFLMVIGDLWQTIGGLLNSRVISSSENDAAITGDVYARLMAMLAAREIRPVIDSVYDFENIAEAHARVDTGHKAGSVVVTLG